MRLKLRGLNDLVRLEEKEEKKKKLVFFLKLLTLLSQSDPALSELYSPFISLTSLRLTGGMNVSLGDDKNPRAVQEKKKEKAKKRFSARLSPARRGGGGGHVGGGEALKKKYFSGTATESLGNDA